MTTNQNKFYYISSGALNAMRTLRHVVSVPGVHFEDTYICNLARDYEEAVVKARTKIGAEAILQSNDFDLNDWGVGQSGLTAKMREYLNKVNAGVMPFGKYAGAMIDSMEAGYVKFWVQQSATNLVGQVLVQKFTDIANERGLFAQWEEEAKLKEDAKQAEISKMSYVGKVDFRSDMFLRCDNIVELVGDYGVTYMNICKDREGNSVVYKGTNRWDAGKYYSVTARVKAHKDYKGYPQTFITRPTVKKIVEA